ncbi:MAG TPA: hypothetical protein VNL71_19785 [Chloroflexota bacterium]|nr:hypothetical protein [Chloroflexota bacterium]
MVPAIAPQKPATLRIESLRMRGHGGRWGMAHFVYAGDRQIRAFGTLAAAKRFIAQSQAVA